MRGELQKIVGANLRAERLGRQLSQEQFADVLGVHRTYLGGLERGERNLTLQSVERLAETLGVAAISLLTRDSGEGGRDAEPARPSRTRRQAR